MKVREIMTDNPACCTPETPLQQVAQMMVECDCGQIPVVSDHLSRRPVGVVTDRDIVCRTVARGENPLTITARAVMTNPVVTVRPEMRVEDCCRVLEEQQVRRAPVADEEGHCCGIVSLADIAMAAPEKLTGEVVKTVSHRSTWPDESDRRML